MVTSVPHRQFRAAQAAAARVRGWVSRQFITRNRRLFGVLAAVTVGIGIAGVHVSQSWFPPGAMILPIMAGGLLLWPRALLILFGVVAATLAYDVPGGRAGPGIIATIVVTAAFELRDRIRAQGKLPALPDGWRSTSVLEPADGASFGGDFLVSASDGKTLEVALVDVPGKGIDAGTRALLLSGAFGGLLGSVPRGEFLASCNAYLRRGSSAEGFVTAVHLSVDLATGDYIVASAGHPPAVHFDAGAGTWRITKARGIVLGVVSDLRSVPERGTLRPGDALMLYTDGLVEVPGRDIDAGIDRLLGEADRLVASGFVAGVGQLVRSMQAGARNSDDCALVLICRV